MLDGISSSVVITVHVREPMSATQRFERYTRAGVGPVLGIQVGHKGLACVIH